MYTEDNALVYDVFPSTISPEFENPYEGRDNEVTRHVLLFTNSDACAFVEGPPSPEARYYGRALVGNEVGDYGEFNAYIQDGTPDPGTRDASTTPLNLDNFEQLEFEFDDLFRRSEEEHRLNEILDEAETDETAPWDGCHGCDCEGDCELKSDDISVEDAVFNIRQLLGELEEVMILHDERRLGTASGLIAPTISESAAAYFYNRVGEIHDSLARSLER